MTDEEAQKLRLSIAQRINESCEGQWASTAPAHMLTTAGTFDAELNNRKTIKPLSFIGGETFALMGASLHEDEIMLKLVPKQAANYRMIDVPLSEADSFLGLESRIEKMEGGQVIHDIQRVQLHERREQIELDKKEAAKREAADRRKRSARYGDNFGSW